MNFKAQVTDFSRLKASCSNCNLSELCLPRSLTPQEFDDLEDIIKRSRPLHRGDHIFRSGDPFHSLYAVRSGTVKLYTTTDAGDDQIMGFYFPGEIMGFDAIENDRHLCSAIALETITYCAFSFTRLEDLCKKIPGLQHQIFRLMSRELSSDNELLLTLSNKNAEEKIATFLVSLSSRFNRLGYSSTEFRLAMSRQEIGNYLGLTIETVSRIFSKLQRENYIATERKIVQIKNLAALKVLCSGSPESAESEKYKVQSVK